MGKSEKIRTDRLFVNAGLTFLIYIKVSFLILEPNHPCFSAMRPLFCQYCCRMCQVEVYRVAFLSGKNHDQNWMTTRIIQKLYISRQLAGIYRDLQFSRYKPDMFSTCKRFINNNKAELR